MFILIFFFLLSLFSYSASGNCPSGSVSWNSNCYLFQTNATEFATAEIACKANNGNLVSIHDAFTNALIVGEAPNYFTDSTFINCSFGWAYFQPTGSCFGFGNPPGKKLNWKDAEEFCENQGAHLASIHSWEEYNFAEIYDFFAWDGHFWIGLFTNDDGRTWAYTDGTPYDYIHWAPDYNVTNPRCAGCGSGGFHQFDGREEKLFICKKKSL